MEQEFPRIVLGIGQRERLIYATTAYVTATLERLLHSLVMPDQETLDFAEQLRNEAQFDTDASAWTCSWEGGSDSHQQVTDFYRAIFAEQQFLQKQVRDFAFAALFHLLEREVRTILMQADTVFKGAVLGNRAVPNNFTKMLNTLAACGYVTEGQSFRYDLGKLELIANAVKHGHGSSLNVLAERFPELFLRRESNEPLIIEHLHYLTPELLRELAASVAAFWEAFPSQKFVPILP